VVTVIFAAPDDARRGVVLAAFAEGDRMEHDIRQLLQSAGCVLAEGFRVDVQTAEGGDRPFEIRYGAAPRVQRGRSVARLVVIKGKADREEYALRKQRTNIGRLAELTDAEDRVVRRNDIVFEEGADAANSSVSRKHAHIREDSGEYRICD